ncbi:hypothetical protein GN244_ATG19660 [Phytophthora infestans]|uniref:Uncharacterized protein n=1 Tax=Phytophthora infestans TaxID=4787 RepID=A0A833RYF4_PHYIN|nr:hypothetical protein GN244_ATG19660 [Phytophthora infestans]KAF4138778.1 hypothetical protein GN958_ATG11987 [Phytophthora infestans]
MEKDNAQNDPPDVNEERQDGLPEGDNRLTSEAVTGRERTSFPSVQRRKHGQIEEGAAPQSNQRIARRRRNEDAWERRRTTTWPTMNSSRHIIHMPQDLRRLHAGHVLQADDQARSDHKVGSQPERGRSYGKRCILKQTHLMMVKEECQALVGLELRGTRCKTKNPKELSGPA